MSKEKDINDFAWDQADNFISPEDLPGAVNQPAEETKEEVTTEEPVKEVKSEKEPDHNWEKDSEEFYENQEEDVTMAEELPESANKHLEEDPEFYKELFDDLKKADVFSIELGEDEEVNSSNFHEVMGREIDARMEEAIDDFMEDVGEEGKNFLSFIKEGGTADEYFRAKAETVTSDNDDIFVRNHLAQQGYDEDDIEDRIELWKQKDKYKDKVEALRIKDKKLKEKAEKELIKKRKAENDKAIKAQEKFNKEVKATISDLDDFNGIPLTKKDKRELPNYLFKASVKNKQTGQYITNFQQDLGKIFNSPEKLAGLANLIKNDFDFSALATKTKTEITKQTRSAIHNSKTRGKIKNKYKGKTLADRI